MTSRQWFAFRISGFLSVILTLTLSLQSVGAKQDPVEGPSGIAGEPNTVVYGEIGKPLSIRCLAYGYPQPTIVWYRTKTNSMVPYSSNLYEARGNVLLIRTLTIETVGEYACEAYNGIGKPASWSVTVDGRGPDLDENVVVVTPREPHTETTTTFSPEIPVIAVYTVPVSTRLVVDAGAVVTAGTELNLPCEVDGYPVPTVYWTKNNERLGNTDRIHVTDARLTISDVNIEDSGVYGCHASNPYSSHSSTVQINVQGLYIPAKCTDNPFFADCQLIVRSKFCHHHYYSKFCCKSCVQAGLLNPQDLQFQSDEAWKRK